MNLFSKKTSLVNSEELVEQVQSDLNAIKSITDSDVKTLKLKEIAKVCMDAHEWNLAWDVIKIISDEKVRNLMIANLIEEYLIPAHEYSKAKEFSKYLIADHEITTLVLIHLAIAEGDLEQACRDVEKLPTPQSRNYALCHIAEAYLMDDDKQKAIEVGKMMIENARVISDPALRSYLLRDVAKNLFLAIGEKELACEAANCIGEESLKKRLLMNIECS